MTLFTAYPLPAEKVWRVSQYWGERVEVYKRWGMKWGHNGVDYPAPEGTPVFSPLAGKAQLGFDAQGFGAYVKIVTPRAEVILAHLSAVTVQHGQQVEAGQQVGKVGSTGASTGPHLHLGLRLLPRRENGQAGYVNPLPHVQRIGGRVSRQGHHYIPVHENPRSRLEVQARWQPRTIKLVQDKPGATGGWNNRDYLAELTQRCPRSDLIIRAWIIDDTNPNVGSEQDEHNLILADPEGRAVVHAQRWAEAAAALKGCFDPQRTYWLSINEPPVWLNEQAFVRYGITYWQTMRQLGLLPGGLNWSVGHPGNHGVADAPPDWSGYEALRTEMEMDGKFAAHEYWDIAGPEQNFGWWAGSVQRSPIRQFIGLYEWGVDRYVNASQQGLPNTQRGWSAWMNAEQYLDQILRGERLLQQTYADDWRLDGITVFTDDGAQPWPSFYIKGAVLDGLAADAEARGWEATAPQRLADVIDPQPPEPVWPVGQRVQTTDKLNIRSQPSTQGERLATAAKGAAGVVRARQGEWYEIDWDDDQLPTGWSFGTYLTAAGPGSGSTGSPDLAAVTQRVEVLERQMAALEARMSAWEAQR